jgi:hypothetical protein
LWGYPNRQKDPKGAFQSKQVYNNQNQTRLMKLNEKKSESLSVLFTSLNSKILKIPKNIHHFRSIFFINNNNKKKKKRKRERSQSSPCVARCSHLTFPSNLYIKRKRKKIKREETLSLDGLSNASLPTTKTKHNSSSLTHQT